MPSGRAPAALIAPAHEFGQSIRIYDRYANRTFLDDEGLAFNSKGSDQITILFECNSHELAAGTNPSLLE